jgi:transaldolase
MRPLSLRTKVFLDSGNPEETKEVLKLLGFLDGQTTNPSLIAKNLIGRKMVEIELLAFYQQTVQEISNLIPNGSVSVEVYADEKTTAEEMLLQARMMYRWIPNAWIKLPIIYEGLRAAEQAVKEKMRINMTLCFTQEQAAAVYAATGGATESVFISPFVGRLDDRGDRGLDLIDNILRMYQGGDGHVKVLGASLRNLNHLAEVNKSGIDIVTLPLKTIKEWAENIFISERSFVSENLGRISYQNLNLNQSWKNFNIKHELTDVGLKKFADDWNGLIDKG